MSLTDASPDDAAKAASRAALSLAILPEEARNHALDAIHNALKESQRDVLEANAVDLARASKAAEDGKLSQSLVKRLDLGRNGKYDDMLKGILDVRNLRDPSKTSSLTRGKLRALTMRAHSWPSTATDTA